MNKNQYYGRVCEKHPELGGLRNKHRRTCVGCLADRAVDGYRRRKGLSEEHIAKLEELRQMRQQLRRAA